MGAPYNNIDLRLEAACEELLTESSNFSAITIATGLNDGTREEDCVIASCDSASERIFDSGLWEADCNISIYTNADATSALATHRTRTANMRDLFMDDGIETSLTGTDESILVSSVHNYSTAQSVEERFFISSLSFTAILSAT
jgi:hypothetical protein|tara:strand:+ start:4800 stop:5228 length:429 start_codon:yes stop_codon:yes gene_type:complete